MMTSGYNTNDLVQEAHIRWLKPAEVLFILQNFEDSQLTHEPPQKPPSGSLFLFNKRVLRFFRKDGHNWRRKKDGRTVGEAHERLKVGNVEALNCYYAHGEQNSNFQRRSYWMLDSTMDHIVLVHYRDITMTVNSGGSVSTLSTGSSTLIQSPEPYTTPLSRAFTQFRDTYDSPSSIEVSSDVFTNSNGSLTEASPNNNNNNNIEIDQALRRIEEQLSLDEENLKDLGIFYNNNELSNDSGFSVHDQDYDDGFNNYASQQYSGGHQYQQQSEGDISIVSQQPLIWTDNPVEEKDVISGYTAAANHNNNPNPSILVPQEVEDFKFPSYARNLSDSYPDFYSTSFDQGQTESSLGLTMSQDQNFTIRDIAPQWGFASEPTKVMIIGTFTCDTSKSKWYCMFGDTEVPVEIIQDGVLSCSAPPFSPGKVTLCITSGNRQSCSEIREFEYHDRSTIYTNTNPPDKKSKSSEELLLLVRFVQMLLSEQEGGEEESWSQVIEAVLDGSLESYDAMDWLIEQLLKAKLQQWLPCRLLSKREQGIIHMISGLGFGWALTPILNSGVGVNFRDINGWTALHWAARFGREKMVAELVASGAFTGAVTDPSQQDPSGKTPASIAAISGHKGLAGYLSELSLTSHPTLQSEQQTQLDIEPQKSLNTNDDLSLKDTLAAVRNATQAAARIQSAFRAHSFRKRQQKESVEGYSFEEDEYGIPLSDIESISLASKSTFRNGNDHNAALSIQKKYRGWKGRKDFLSLRQKVVKIQAHVRGHQVRKNYQVFCWAVGVVEKVVLRWRRKGVGLRGFKQGGDESEDEDIVKAFRKKKVDVSIDEAVSRVLSMVDSQQARQQYRRMLLKYREAKAERQGLEIEGGSTSQGDVMKM